MRKGERVLYVPSTEMGHPYRTSALRGRSTPAGRSARVRRGPYVKENHRQLVCRAAGDVAKFTYGECLPFSCEEKGGLRTVADETASYAVLVRDKDGVERYNHQGCFCLSYACS